MSQLGCLPGWVRKHQAGSPYLLESGGCDTLRCALPQPQGPRPVGLPFATFQISAFAVVCVISRLYNCA